MHKKLWLIAAITVGVFSFKAYADTLHQTAFKILTGSPEYQSEIYSLEATGKNLHTDANLPDPEIGGEYLWMPSDVVNRWAVELTWGIEWPGVYGARGKEAKSKLDAAQSQVIAARAQRLAEIKDLLLDYIRCRQKLMLLNELEQNNDTIYRLAEKEAKGGELTVLDLNKVRLEYANIRVAKAGLLDEEAEVISEISRIYGKDCSGLLENMDCRFPEIILPDERALEAIRENAPAVKAAQAEAEAARMAKKVAKMEALPSLTVGYKHQYEDYMHFNGAILGVSIPIFSSRGKQKAADADIIDAEFKAEAAALEIETDAKAALRRLKLILSQIDEIAPIIENADYNAALLKAYKGGALTLLEYISDRNYFTSAAIELVSLRHNAAKTLALLQRFITNP